MSLRCNLGLHRWSPSEEVLSPSVGTVSGFSRCLRPGCSRERTWTALAPGWVRESICDDVSCYRDGEHPVHTVRQRQRIAWQQDLRREAVEADRR